MQHRMFRTTDHLLSGGMRHFIENGVEAYRVASKWYLLIQGGIISRYANLITYGDGLNIKNRL